MLNGLYRTADYLSYLFTAKSRHGLHSPFIYSFYESVIQAEGRPAIADHIETVRKKMIQSPAVIDFTDLGSGKKTGPRKISEIASNTGRQSKYGRLLYRLLMWQKPYYALELGTATGMTALYMASALDPERPMHTIEGSASLSEVAAFNASQLGLQDQIVFHSGDFDSVLPGLLSQMPRVDFAYIDGNHRYEPTLRYFDMLASRAHPGSVLVFDDIWWSEEMKQAWSAIKKDPRVTVSIDIFAFGLVFFHKGQEKEHFTLRY